jgi:hypothetical protein
MGPRLAQCNLKLTSMSAGLIMAYIKTPKHVTFNFNLHVKNKRLALCD